MKRYKNIEIDYGVNAEIMENFEREQELAAMTAASEDPLYEDHQADDSVVEASAANEPETPDIIELD